MKPGKTGLRRLLDATGYSWRGLRAAFKHEAAFRQELALLVAAMVAAIFVARSLLQFLLLAAPLLILLIVELLNSAIEAVVDRIGSEAHELSGRAKDMGSASVFIALVLVGFSWAIIIVENYLI